MKRYKIIFFLFLIILVVWFFSFQNKEVIIADLSNYSLKEIENYAKENNLQLIIIEDYDKNIKKGNVIKQKPETNSVAAINQKLIITISLGAYSHETYQKHSINELGKIPIMMYHGIVDMLNDETNYTGGNVDIEGYNRTTEAFRNDLEMYYQEGYRMIRLKDYIEGIIDTEFGKSPIILTFDDGNKNNINILGKDEQGNLIIDSNSAIGILEHFKHKYPDYKVTATFFINEGLFQQPAYDYEIIKWIINNGYDIGNHTKGHVNFSDASISKVQSSIAYMYQKLDEIIPGKYLNVIALPYGSPFTKKHEIFPYILEGEHNGYKYKTDSTLRVGWDSEYSPFHQNFDKTFLTRIRAWDNNGEDFDIEMGFNLLKETRYISDGNKETIVIPKSKKKYL